MGFIEWLKRMKEEAAAKNKATHDAKMAYYQSEDYKKQFAESQKQKMKEGKGSDFGSWMKRVSNNAAAQLNNESLKIDKEKLIGKRK